MGQEAQVFIIDDDHDARAAMSELVESIGLTTRIFGDGAQFLEAFDPRAPGCILIDLRLPGLDGLEVLGRLAQQEIAPPAIMVTGFADIASAVQAMQMGAVDFFEKPYRPQELLDSIRQAVSRDARNRSEFARRAELRRRAEQLTPREREVMVWVVAGLTNKQIAARFKVSCQAIDAHRARAMKKMQAGTVGELVRIAMTAGLDWPDCGDSASP